MKKIVLFSLCLIGLASRANNVSITNISAPSTTTVQFDIAWDNSWYTSSPPSNWDGVWVFVKAQVCPGTWNHANLSTVSSDHSVSGGVLQVDAVTDGKGVFIRRSAAGVGSISTSTVVLKFSSAYVIANTNYDVIGIEVVNVPTGTFYVGDGGGSLYEFGAGCQSGSGFPWQMSGEGAIGANCMNSGAMNITGIPAALPKGYNGFYCMKYEITQNQYATFLNLLDYASQVNRTANNPSSPMGTAALTSSPGLNRNSIEIKTPSVTATTYIRPAVYGNDLNNNNVYDESDDGGDVACNFLSWEDLKAYLDWSALRPMTEFEFEKSARGILYPTSAEYPWSTTTINQAISNSLTNGGQSSEVSTSTSTGLCAYNAGSSTTLGPLRVGFAATATSTRPDAGASYYGIMDLGGNVWEQTIGFHQSVNPYIYTGTLGDGTLDSGGNADASNWGSYIYTIVRGGNWEQTATYVKTSDRSNYNNQGAENNLRVRRTGGRGVR